MSLEYWFTAVSVFKVSPLFDISLASLMSPTTESEEAGLGAGAASGDAAAERRGEERGDDRLWRSVVIGEQEHRIDMKCIQPYKKVISHGGMETQMVGISFP